MKKFLFMTLFFLFLFGCDKKIDIQLKGFAVFDKVSNPYLYKAISPEGVVLQISIKKNYPETADRKYWHEAVKKYVPQKGYQLVKDGKTEKGSYFIFLVPGNKYDFFYLVHFMIHNGNIYLTEAGGQYGYLKNYEKNIFDFIDKLEKKYFKT